jgi:hypothetical protein
MAYGVILTLIPDWSHHLGIANKGLFFMVFTVTSLLIRFGAGKASDKLRTFKANGNWPGHSDCFIRGLSPFHSP